jgi:hypothetical protein
MHSDLEDISYTEDFFANLKNQQSTKVAEVELFNVIDDISESDFHIR